MLVNLFIGLNNWGYATALASTPNVAVLGWLLTLVAMVDAYYMPRADCGDGHENVDLKS